MNYFDFDSAALRYAAARPFFHPIVRDLIRNELGPRSPVARAIDVACGTGLSTRILADLANEVDATDLSEAMLRVAWPRKNVRYVCARAEELPFPDAHFDLMTVALAFHWLERERFLVEARRVLRPCALLVIYNQGFTGEMACNPDFARWNRGTYLVRFPTPERDRRPFGATEAAQAGFAWIGQTKFTHYWPFSPDALAHYLATQSNVIAAVEAGVESATAVHEWLVAQLQPYFSLAQEAFLFGGSVSMLRNQSGPPSPLPGPTRAIR